MLLPEGTMLPSEQERKQIFHWLKRISSYTAWNRMLGYYQTWADIVEQSVRIAVDKGWAEKTGLSESKLIEILNGLAHFEEGVRRLRTGDKRVFKYDANGEFVMGLRFPLHWSELLQRIEWQETEIDEEHTPLWNEINAAFGQHAEATGECLPDIIESQWLEEPAHTFYGEYLRNLLTKMTFPDPLPDVPDPRDNLLIPTGREVPCSGIWEPIDVQPVKQSFSLIRKTDNPKGPFAPIGCMSYLHAGSPAPNMAAYGEKDGLPCTWRLIWRDDRYEDGTIPAEEAEYVFLRPEPPAPETSAPTSRGDLVMAESGQKAPKAGRWLAEDDLNASITLEAGEQLPRHKGRHIRWVPSEKS